MLFFYINYCWPVWILLSLIAWAFAGYAYRVNAKRLAGDPKKRDFHPAAIFLAPILWPLFLFGYISILVIKVVAYGVFLVLFTVALFVFQKSSVPWLDDTAAWIGDKLLGANTFLIKVAFGDWEKNTRPI
jgi:hypothetical protein